MPDEPGTIRRAQHALHAYALDRGTTEGLQQVFALLHEAHAEFDRLAAAADAVIEAWEDDPSHQVRHLSDLYRTLNALRATRQGADDDTA